MKTRIYVVGIPDAPVLVEAKSAAAALKIACDDMRMETRVATPKDVAHLLKDGVTFLNDKSNPQQSLPGA